MFAYLVLWECNAHVVVPAMVEDLGSCIAKFGKMSVIDCKHNCRP